MLCVVGSSPTVPTPVNGAGWEFDPPLPHHSDKVVPMFYTMTEAQQMLSRQIAWGDGWWVAVIIDNGSGNAETLVSDVITQMSSKGTPSVDARTTDDETLDENFHSFAVGGSSTPAPTILGAIPGCSTISGEAWWKGFSYLNSRRESMRRRDIPLVLVIPSEHTELLIRGAVDLWSIRDLTITI